MFSDELTVIVKAQAGEYSFFVPSDKVDDSQSRVHVTAIKTDSYAIVTLPDDLRSILHVDLNDLV